MKKLTMAIMAKIVIILDIPKEDEIKKEPGLILPKIHLKVELIIKFYMIVI